MYKVNEIVKVGKNNRKSKILAINDSGYKIKYLENGKVKNIWKNQIDMVQNVVEHY